MHYMIKCGNNVSHYGSGRVAAVVATTSEEGPEEAGILIDVAGANGLRIKLVVKPADFDDEASGVQLKRLAERIQLMATAASNRRAVSLIEVRDAGGGVP